MQLSGRSRPNVLIWKLLEKVLDKSRQARSQKWTSEPRNQVWRDLISAFVVVVVVVVVVAAAAAAAAVVVSGH